MRTGPTISARKLAILALLESADSPIVGITRLQKLLFLLWKRLQRLSPDRQFVADFNFQPQRYGPADFAIYSDLEFLIALGHILRDSGPTDPAALVSENDEPEQRPVEEMTEDSYGFDYLMSDEEGIGELAAADRRLESYRITPQGGQLLERIADSGPDVQRELIGRIRRSAADVVQEYGSWPLQRLLRYVYAEYPEMTTSSEIRERVLGRR